MGIGYCIRCQAKVELKETSILYYKNGTPAEKGLCSKCGSKVLRMLRKEEKEALKAKGVANDQA